MIWQSPLWQFGLYPVLNMSLTAGIIILLVLVMRLALRRAPRIFSYILNLCLKIYLFSFINDASVSFRILG